jgi:prepilin-type N-terminal cleavage/methylation domain-containing protein
MHTQPPPGCRTARDGFTLVELLVTMVIIAMLASLTLAGLAGARQRAKIDKTRSTIRKINEIILPQYESYLTRRVFAAGGTRTLVETARLTNRRILMVLEMPDQWADVGVPPPLPLKSTAPMIRYSTAKPTSSPNLTKYESAECLALIVMRGGFNPDAAEAFRNDEVGDIDKDGAPEFLDGWGRPIGFIRWPAGFASPIQLLNATQNPDPMDPMNVSSDYGLTPLIFSPGPDEALNDPLTSGGPTYGGLQSSAAAVPGGWIAGLPITSVRVGSPLAGELIDAAAARDNVTNHDLLKK